MKHIRKFNESHNSLLERNDDSITKIVNIIEDTLVEFNIECSININRDERVQDETEYTSNEKILMKNER